MEVNHETRRGEQAEEKRKEIALKIDFGSKKKNEA